MSKIKGILEEDMSKYPELYDGTADYEFWIECNKNKSIKKKDKYNVKRKKSN